MIRFCTRCVISSMRPRITFDADGVCSACRFAEIKEATDWAERELQLQELCHQHRSHDGSFDVVVPVSGGKDGGFTAHMLKTVYGMHPLCVTFAPLLPTDIGRHNLDAFIASGFDVIQGHPNGQVARKLARLAFEHMGDIFQPFIYGQTHLPLRIAAQEKISLIFYGEDGDRAYGGESAEHRAKRTIDDHNGNYFSGKPPEFWLQHGLTPAELEIFLPSRAEKDFVPEIHFFGYYTDWVPQWNFYHCVENTGFTPNPDRTVGTWSRYASLDDELDFLHYYMAFIKFGIGRATSDAAHEIRDGHISREEGIALVKKYDGEFSERHWNLALDYMGISDREGRAIINKWRSPEIWNGEKLRFAVWMSDSGVE